MKLNKQKSKWYKLIKSIVLIPRRITDFFTFTFFITIYVTLHLLQRLSHKLKFLTSIANRLKAFAQNLEKHNTNRITKGDIISLAIQNMAYKKKRTRITIGGMAIGIASIVFLVSIGYGLQTLVIERVARLEELRQAEVSILPGTNILINDETIKKIEAIPNVNMAFPVISVVGKVNYNNSQIDTAVYGVTHDYLKQSAISPTKGQLFINNETETAIVPSVEIISTVENTQNDDIKSGWIEIEGESAPPTELQISKIKFPEEIEDKDVVVNRSFLRVLDLNESEALGKAFKISLIATNKSLLDDQDRLESTETEYTIIGVTPDDITPLIYIPFQHLKSLGIKSYSQLKIETINQDSLPKVRQEIESMGYTTNSVSDTVKQINQLFTSARFLLASIGTVALFVAALGMSNTLTVSLLERLREIGLLKTMGMKSHEVRDLFLAESMIMGSSGGFIGLVTGLLVGKILEAGLSIYSISQGIGALSIVDIPISFAITVILLSFLVGIITGTYPAKQATQISALNALRYE